MDIAFTIAVWILLVTLTAYGLRLTNRADARGVVEETTTVVYLPLPEHPVFSRAPAPRELVGAGS